MHQYVIIALVALVVIVTWTTFSITGPPRGKTSKHIWAMDKTKVSTYGSAHLIEPAVWNKIVSKSAVRDVYAAFLERYPRTSRVVVGGGVGVDWWFWHDFLLTYMLDDQAALNDEVRVSTEKCPVAWSSLDGFNIPPANCHCDSAAEELRVYAGTDINGLPIYLCAALGQGLQTYCGKGSLDMWNGGPVRDTRAPHYVYGSCYCKPGELMYLWEGTIAKCATPIGIQSLDTRVKWSPVSTE